MKPRKPPEADKSLTSESSKGVPSDRLYSEHHIWVKMENEGAKIGATDFAGQELGEVDFVELPEPGELTARHTSFGIVETSKAVTDLIAPISGTVTKVNALLDTSPNLMTDDPFGEGWLLIVEPSALSELRDLMTHDQYRLLVHGEIEDRVSAQVEILQTKDY